MLKKTIYGFLENYSKDPHLAKFNLRKHFVRKEKLYQTCYSMNKRNALLQLFREMVATVSGDVAECGCLAAGGTVLMAEVLKSMAPHKHIYAFDTFEGMPEPTENDKMSDGTISYNKGVLIGPSLKLAEAKADYFKVRQWITFTKGLFQDTVSKVIKDSDRFCFVVIDPDQYEGTKYCLHFFYHKVETGGVVILDDYAIPDEDLLDTPGVKIATEEFLEGKPEKPMHLADSMYYFVKQ